MYTRVTDKAEDMYEYNRLTKTKAQDLHAYSRLTKD